MANSTSVSAVLFEWNNGAAFEKVQLAGSFTEWKPVEMVKTLGSDKWAFKLDLPPGEYEFKFVVDGNWVHDEGQPSKTNQMGTLNNVICVPHPKEPILTREDGRRSISPSNMSVSSSIEAIDEDDDEGWEIIDENTSKTQNIEVERKFLVPDNYHDRLINHGFRLEQEFDEVLVDKYFDTHKHHLLKEDFWLRQRNGDWELKYPVGTRSRDGKGSTIYHETSCVDDIMLKIQPILEMADKSFIDLINEKILEPFAHLETRRKNYNKDDLNVVIDATDWGHIVGEIEVMVTDQQQIAEASKRIEDLGKELDFSPMDLNVLYHKICK